MKQGSKVWCVLGLSLLTACGDAGSSGLPEGVTEAHSELARDMNPNAKHSDVEALAKDNRAFGIGMYRALRSQPGNLFLSPYSISSALAMTYAGAKGQTATQMKSALQFDVPDNDLHHAFDAIDLQLAARDRTSKEDGVGPFQLSVVNAVWTQKAYHIEASYLDTLAVNYGAGVYQLDFSNAPDAATDKINGWVADQTHNRIQKLLKPGVLNSNTRVVLTNAAYFKAAWSRPFQKSMTKDGTFHGLAGDVTVPMMARSDNASYGEGEGYRGVLLPYAAPELGMLVIVPDAGNFAAFDQAFDAAKFEEVLTNVDATYDVDLQLPRFEARSSVDLIPALHTLGMTDAFDDGLADFSGITGSSDLAIGSVQHQAWVKVDEDGTEAAGATSVGLEAVSEPPPAELHVDRPFLFAIIDRSTGTLLFLGRVVNPQN